MNQPTGTRPSDGTDRWLIRAMIILVALLVSCLFLFLFTTTYGAVSGEEFCPTAFSRRSFDYIEIPLIHVQITAVKRKNASNDLEQYLVKQKLVPTAASMSPRWDLVVTYRADAETSHGDARILCTYLDAEDEGRNLYWLKWSEANPDLANVLWPIVAELADQQLYILLPDLFQIAQSAADVVSLTEQLDGVLHQGYRELAATQQELGNHQSAASLLQAALKRFPEDPQLQAELAVVRSDSGTEQ